MLISTSVNVLHLLLARVIAQCELLFTIGTIGRVKIVVNLDDCGVYNILCQALLGQCLNAERYGNVHHQPYTRLPSVSHPSKAKEKSPSKSSQVFHPNPSQISFISYIVFDLLTNHLSVRTRSVCSRLRSCIVPNLKSSLIGSWL